MKIANTIGGKRILYIGSGRDIIEILDKAKACGHYLVYLFDKNKFNPKIVEVADEIHLVDFSDFEFILKFVEFLHHKHQFTSVLSLNESSTYLAARLRTFFSFKGTSDKTSYLLKNKAEMRCFLKDVKFSIGETENDIIHFLNSVQGDIIVKPVDESGSFMIYKVTKRKEAFEVAEAFKSSGIKHFLMEEYLLGNEYSVEAFSYNGQHQVIAITEKFVTKNHVECGHLTPARLSEEDEVKIKDSILLFLSKINFTYGPTHTEIKYHNNKVSIIESHDRTGGDRINELVRLATGIDMRKAYFEMYTDNFSFPLMATCQKSAAIQFFTEGPGVLSDIYVPENISDQPGHHELQITVTPGTRLNEVRDSSGRLGHVMAYGNSNIEALFNCHEIFKKIKWIF